MKKYISLLCAVLMTAFTVSALAFTPPPKPDNGWYIVDQTNKLTEEQKTILNKKIDSLNKNTKNEFGVLLIQSMDGDNIEDVAQNTFRSWGIGKVGLNNGVLLVISVGDRKMRLQTGKGAEGDLPDLRAKDILDNNLKPFLKKGDFYGGINSTLDATSSFMESRATQSVPEKTEENSAPVPIVSNTSSSNTNIGGVLWFLLSVFGLGGLVAFFIARNVRKEREVELARNEAYQKQESFNREARRLQREKEAAALAEETKRKIAQEKQSSFTYPPIPSVPTPHHQSAAKAIVNPNRSTTTSVTDVGTAAAVSLGTAIAVSSLSRDEEAKKRKKREEEEKRQAEAAARKRRDEEEAVARRQRDESYVSSYSSYSSSSSSYDSGSSSSSGGGFGGGDSGGGGASSDW